MTEPVRVLLVDDHAPFRNGLQALLASAPEVEVVGVAGDGAEAVIRAGLLQPDVILMDLDMPRMSGVEATRAVLETSPHIAVLVLTMLEDDDSVFAALQAGARGYLLKGALKAEILRAIRAVVSGEAIFGPAVARRLVSFFSRPAAPSAAAAFPGLSPREREVLELMVEHRTNPDIARQLGLSEKTVRNLASSVFAKLRAADRAHAVALAREAGLGGSS